MPHELFDTSARFRKLVTVWSVFEVHSCVFSDFQAKRHWLTIMFLGIGEWNFIQHQPQFTTRLEYANYHF